MGKEIGVRVTVDRVLKGAWLKSERLLRESQAAGARAWDAFYETVGDVLDHDPPLYLAGGYSTIRDFLKAYVPSENERSVRKNVRVARYASPAEEEKYTVTKLDAVLTLLDAKVGRSNGGRVPVNFAKVRVPAVRDGKPAHLTIEEATLEEIRAATRAAAHPATHAKRSPVVAEVQRVLAGVKAAKGISVRYFDGKVSIGHIPVHAFRDVVRALGKAKLPTPES